MSIDAGSVEDLACGSPDRFGGKGGARIVLVSGKRPLAMTVEHAPCRLKGAPEKAATFGLA